MKYQSRKRIKKIRQCLTVLEISVKLRLNSDKEIERKSLKVSQ